MSETTHCDLAVVMIHILLLVSSQRFPKAELCADRGKVPCFESELTRDCGRHLAR